MRISIEIIPHMDQRSGSTGEWWIDQDGSLQVRVSDLGNLDYVKLHVIHELFEAFASTYNKNVALDVAEHFDARFVGKDKRELPAYFDEIGFHPDCPYHDEHVAATGVEMLLAPFLRVKWLDYDKRVRAIAAGDIE
jgi:hypothetical protein